MKQSEFRSIINECVREVLAEGRHSKKAKAIKAIREIITENELDEADIEEGKFGDFAKKAVGAVKTAVSGKPVTNQDVDAYLAKNPKLKAMVNGFDADKKAKWYKIVIAKKADRIKNDEAILNLKWDDVKKDWIETAAPSKGGGLNLENKKR